MSINDLALEITTLKIVQGYIEKKKNIEFKEMASVLESTLNSTGSCGDLNLDELLKLDIKKRLHNNIGANNVGELLCRLAYSVLWPDLVDNKIIIIKLLMRLNEINIAQEWIASIKSLATLSPNDCASLAYFVSELGDTLNAIELYKTALRGDSSKHLVWYNLGNCYNRVHQPKNAIDCYEKSIRIKQDQPLAWYNLGNAFRVLGLYSEAEKSYKYSLWLDNQFASAFTNLGVTYLNMGRAEEAISYFKSAILVDKNVATNWSGLAMGSQYSIELTPEKRYEVHKRFGAIALQDKQFNTERLNYDSVHKIRIGFVSGDFKMHSVTNFLMPIFISPDRKNFELYCFSNGQTHDDITEWYKIHSDKFLEISSLNTSQACDLIAEHKIDILVDLSGHTDGNRLDIFAIKPARVTVSWLGYPGTTGLPNMDFKIVCRATDYAKDQQFYTEKLLYLEPMIFCFAPHDEELLPDLNGYSSSDHIRFGSFNHSAKFNEAILSTWCELLKSVSNSTLRLKSGCFFDESCRTEFEAFFHERGIDKKRLILQGYCKDKYEHFYLYNEIDIALDVTPFSGATTTCEALFMGKPVVTLHGASHAGRVTSAILKLQGMSELVANNVSEYVSIATELSKNLSDAKYQSSKIRKNFLKSSICDGDAFSKSFFNLMDSIRYE